jgi:ATP-dependent RNA helicase SUPV3L1/SUV3
MVNAEVTSSGELSFEGQIAGRIQGFRYTQDANIGAAPAIVDSGEAANAIAQEFEVRASRLSEAVDSALVLANDGAIRWLGDPVAKIAAGESLLAPRALILADESLAGTTRQKVQTRVDLWLAAYVRRLLGPLFELDAGVGLEGAARHVATQLVEALGVLERGRVAQDVKTLDQSARGMLRKLGVRFGAYYIYIPTLVKPAVRVLATQLWALRQDDSALGSGLHDIPQLAASGRTSFVADSVISKEVYRVAGFRLCGDRAVRVDIVERLADLIRPAVAYRPGANAGAPPPGSADADGFVVTGAMTSLTGCSGEQFASVLRSLGFVSRLVKGPALTIPESAPVVSVAGDAASGLADMQPTAAVETLAAAAVEAPSTATDGEKAEAENFAAGDQPLGELVAPSATDEYPEPVAIADGSGMADDGEDAKQEAAAPDELQPADAQATALIAVDRALEAPAPEPSERSEAKPALDDGAPGESLEPAQETLIEVWRPRPPNRQRNPRGGARDHISKSLAAAPEGDGQMSRRDETPDKVRNRRRGPSQRPPSQSIEAAPRATGGSDRSGAGLETRQTDSANRAESGIGRSGGPNRGRPPDERSQRGRRPERPPAPPVPQREPPVNLNSPFAKLLALKAQLETKGKGD